MRAPNPPSPPLAKGGNDFFLFQGGDITRIITSTLSRNFYSYENASVFGELKFVEADPAISAKGKIAATWASIKR
jgi:hypothetical protein